MRALRRRRRRRRGVGGRGRATARSSTSSTRSTAAAATALYMPAGGSLQPAVARDGRPAPALRQAGRRAPCSSSPCGRPRKSRAGSSSATVSRTTDLDLFVSHQANRRIIESAAEKLGLSPDKVIINIERIRQHDRRDHSARAERRRLLGTPEEGRPGAAGVGRRRIHGRRRAPALGILNRVFLLSPASCRGRRAAQLLSPRATTSLAAQLRSAEGAPLGDVFAFVSSLYFRGKLTYARRFAAPHDIHVITPTAGLQSPDTLVTHASILRIRRRRHRSRELRATRTAARAERVGAARGRRRHVRRRAARQHRLAEVRRRARADLRRAPAVSDRLRRPRRHEPRRPAAAESQRGRRAGLRGRGRRGQARAAPAEAPAQVRALMAPAIPTGEDNVVLRRRRQRGPPHEPPQAVLAGARAHQGRSAAVLRVGRRRAAAAHPRSRDGDEALSARRLRPFFFMKRAPTPRPPWIRHVRDRSRIPATSSTFP